MNNFVMDNFVMDNFLTPWGNFSVERWPPGQSTGLRAWDAADELLLQHLDKTYGDSWLSKARTLIINDAHGALCCALDFIGPVSWSDSFLSRCSAQSNIETNHPGNLHSGHLRTFVPSVETPAGSFDLVLIKVPKTIALLEDQLARLHPLLAPEAVVVAAGMVKHLPRSAFLAFEHYLGPVSTSLAAKKARLIFASVCASKAFKASPYPSQYLHESLNIELLNHANVFSRERLDTGTRFLLQQFHRLPPGNRVIDLACGNGIIGIHVLQRFQPDKLTFIDESYMAIASAKENLSRIPVAGSTLCEFVIADGLTAQPEHSAELIISNPPFHSQQAISVQTAQQFFTRSHKVLVQAGELWFVANRHLDYGGFVKRIFGHCQRIAGNRKFTVYRACKR